MGKQLDSLADTVSFGVAPGYDHLPVPPPVLCAATDGLDINILWLLPAFIIPCAGAYRLARFNIDPPGPWIQRRTHSRDRLADRIIANGILVFGV
jgi:phosphatidylserine synthase